MALLVVCDLDGTLLRSDATLSKYARDGLNRLLNHGTAVTVATARSPQAITALLAGVNLRLPVIGLNGALISDLQTGGHLVIRALDATPARTAIAMLETAHASPVVTSWDGGADRVHHRERMNPASEWWIEEKRAYGDHRLQLTEELDPVATLENVVMITGFVPTSSDDQLVRDLSTELSDTAVIHAADHIYYQGWTEIQIQHPLADKGTALAQLVELTGLRDLTLVACGDHLNDLGMFAVADESVAPANAHPAALSTATSTAASNENDGIIAWLLNRAGQAGK
jgi:Cof subfamily protein (haloacid dehalogenase superfamily)